ncbi:hypothetical protein FA15DRAFT_575175, partial [Coprinopsis marcescibilis]
GFCWNEECINSASLQCSICKTACTGCFFHDAECQQVTWKERKKECPQHKKAYDMNRILDQMNAEREAQPPPAPRQTHCTGCNERFSEDNPDDQVCPDCGYATCESCSYSNSRGSCYCENSNFGEFYCDRVPKYYHCSSHTGRHCKGDHHPEEYTAQDSPELFEARPRKCGTCGEVKLCMKKKYLN